MKPSSVVGHYSGEIAAAYCAGFLNLEDALRIACFRGKCSAAAALTNQRGAMLAIGLAAEKTIGMITQFGINKVQVACFNSPNSTTVSRDIDGIEELQRSLVERGKFCRRLEVTVAYHSAHMDSIKEAYFEAIKPVEPRQPEESAPLMYSSVTGVLVSQYHALEARYWMDNLVCPVSYQTALEELVLSLGGLDAIVELPPSTALRFSIRDTLDCLKLKRRPVYASCISRNERFCQTILNTAGTLRSLGVLLEFELVNNLEVLPAKPYCSNGPALLLLESQVCHPHNTDNC